MTGMSKNGKALGGWGEEATLTTVVSAELVC